MVRKKMMPSFLLCATSFPTYPYYIPASNQLAQKSQTARLSTECHYVHAGNKGTTTCRPPIAVNKTPIDQVRYHKSHLPSLGID
ncbi:hypothetical protein BKA56DRAFT_166623 [Ilyonectria sp. MPI-CAGE-AT-0026]|nr:hypothetical protein BKA56DRAFT_166623 [Ilyonectria sp. MPI-CAGE-AT-0026]